MLPPGKSLILFDGVCNFCNASVNFIIDRDQDDFFRLASLQSELGQQILKEHAKPLSDFDTLLLIQDGQIFEKSTAALMIARRLSFPWFLFTVFLVLPRWIRDPVYSLVAKNRYRLFGKSQICRLPTEKDRHKILG